MLLKNKKGWDTLTKTQQKLYKILENHKDAPLTFRQMAFELNANSHNTVIHHLKQLEKKGYIIKKNNGEIDVLENPINDIIYLDLYGLCKCGPKGFFNDDNIIEKIPMPAKTLKLNQNSFLVRAKGNSMEPEIYENDLVLAEKKQTCENGDFGIVVYREESFIKKIKLNFEKKLIYLISLNKKYKTITIKNSKDIKIIGTVKNIIHAPQ